MSKKVLSVVMAVIMLLSCCALAASAYTYAPTQTTGEVVISATADKTTVNPGDEVTITMSINRGSKGELGAFGNTIVYNGDQLTPVGTTPQTFRTWEGDCAASFANPNASGNMNYAVATQLKAQMTEEELAYFTKGIMILGSATSSKLRWNPTDTEAYMSFKMTVSNDVQPGDEIWVGTPQAAFVKGASYFAEGTKRMTNDVYDLTNSMVKLTVAGGETPAAPVLTKTSAQVKMTPNSATTVEDAFQFRVVSKISDADWTTYFANTGVADATTNAITSVGFVAYKGTEGFSLDTAKAVAAGTAADGYSVATTDYIQHTDGADAQFGCRLEITSAETRSDVTYVAFAQYVDASGAAQVVFYDAAYEALLATNYTGIVASYLAAFPFAG